MKLQSHSINFCLYVDHWGDLTWKHDCTVIIIIIICTFVRQSVSAVKLNRRCWESLGGQHWWEYWWATWKVVHVNICVKTTQSHQSVCVLCMQCECLAVACGQSQSVNETNRQQLVSDIIDRQWRDDNVIQHITSHALAKSNSSAHCNRSFISTSTAVITKVNKKPS